MLVVYTGDWGQRSKVMKRSEFTCPRSITAISSFESSLSKGDNVVKLLKVKGLDERSEVMMKGQR